MQNPAAGCEPLSRLRAVAGRLGLRAALEGSLPVQIPAGCGHERAQCPVTRAGGDANCSGRAGLERDPGHPGNLKLESQGPRRGSCPGGQGSSGFLPASGPRVEVTGKQVSTRTAPSPQWGLRKSGGLVGGATVAEDDAFVCGRRRPAPRRGCVPGPKDVKKCASPTREELGLRASPQAGSWARASPLRGPASADAGRPLAAGSRGVPALLLCSAVAPAQAGGGLRPWLPDGWPCHQDGALGPGAEGPLEHPAR